MSSRTVSLQRWDGGADGWKARLPLRNDETEEIVVDGRRLAFATPTFLLRLRCFVEWHLGNGRRVRVLMPSDGNVCNYMARMRIGKGLPKDSFVGLPSVREHDRSDVLVPITRLRTAQDVDRFNQDIAPVIAAQTDDVAVLEEALAMAVSELCGNAVEHGDNPLGCYVAVQRYPAKNETVLAVGDLGCGIPKNIRGHFSEVDSDRAALRHALREGVTTTGQASRGQGFYWVMDTARESRVRMARLDIRAGRGRAVRRLGPDGSLRTSAQEAPNKMGTWVTFELGSRS